MWDEISDASDADSATAAADTNAEPDATVTAHKLRQTARYRWPGQNHFTKQTSLVPLRMP